jgi:hypothetical protein
VLHGLIIPRHPASSQNCLLQTYGNCERGPNTSIPPCQQSGMPPANLHGKCECGPITSVLSCQQTGSPTANLKKLRMWTQHVHTNLPTQTGLSPANMGTRRTQHLHTTLSANSQDCFLQTYMETVSEDPPTPSYHPDSRQECLLQTYGN